MAWTTPRTWVAAETVTASLMNTHLRDNLNAIAAVGIDGWTAVTPAWTGTTNPTYTVSYARYCQIGKLVYYRARYTYTSGGTGTWFWALPVTAAETAANIVCGNGYLYDDSGTDTWLTVMDIATTTTLRASYDLQTNPGLVAQTAPFTFASPDVVEFAVTYEAA